jgi:hypothetical protein
MYSNLQHINKYITLLSYVYLKKVYKLLYVIYLLLPHIF